MSKLIDLTGKRFGKLTVAKYLGKSFWLCKCDCGNEKIIYGNSLKRGLSDSCGCLKSKRLKNKLRIYKDLPYNKEQLRLHKIWEHMQSRCFDKSNNRHHIYGARGIKVCEKWLKFENFYNWAINNGYQNNLTIDRIDNDCDYEPFNCRWVTYKEQSRNKRNNRLITYQNQTKCISEWEEITNLPIYQRLNKLGWSIKKTFTTPKRGKNAKIK